VTGNPANPIVAHAPVASNFTGTEADCDAVNTCARLTNTQGYLSFDLHYMIAEALWSCTSYFGASVDASYFSVQDGDVGNSYGYSGVVVFGV
jgi:hypothetical protein